MINQHLSNSNFILVGFGYEAMQIETKCWTFGQIAVTVHKLGKEPRTTDTQWRYKSKISEKLGWWGGEHITDTYITETDTTELENLIHNIIDIFIIKT